MRGFLYEVLWENLFRMKGWSKPFRKLREEPSSSWNSKYKSPEKQLCVTCSGNSKEATVAGTDKAEKVEDEIREITGVRF